MQPQGSIVGQLVVVEIQANTESGRQFARHRRDEINIGHDNELIVALGHRPLVVSSYELLGDLGAYADNVDLDSLADFGLSWRIVDTQTPVDFLASLDWHDWDLRSAWVGEQICAGRIAADDTERSLASQWVTWGRRYVEVQDNVDDERRREVTALRPSVHLRESPRRTAIRNYVNELREALEAADGAERRTNKWERAGDTLALEDGSTLRVEPVEQDAGYIPGAYQVSRYSEPPPQYPGRKNEALIERFFL